MNVSKSNSKLGTRKIAVIALDNLETSTLQTLDTKLKPATSSYLNKIFYLNPSKTPSDIHNDMSLQYWYTCECRNHYLTGIRLYLKIETNLFHVAPSENDRIFCTTFTMRVR